MNLSGKGCYVWPFTGQPATNATDMANIKPFKAIRPVRDKVHLVATRSYVTYSKSALERKLNENPYSFIHIINPEHYRKNKTKPNSPERFRNVRKRYDTFREQGVLKQDKRNAFYIYRQIKGKYQWTGIIGAASSKDYQKGIIRKHEKTLEHREKVFKEYLKITRINAEPVLFTYPDDQAVRNDIKSYMKEDPEYDFTTMDQVRHTLWVLDDKSVIDHIRDCFKQYDALYIADGHHRTASSVRLSRELRREGGNSRALFNAFMTYFIPESSLKIFPFHRLIKKGAGMPESQFLDALNQDFEVVAENSRPGMEPPEIHQIGMWLNKQYYWLRPKRGTYDKHDPVKSLDVSVFSDLILNKVLQIRDQKKDKRVEFIGGENRESEIAGLIASGKYEMAFLLHPVTLQQIKAVADAGMTLPPKSTYIEPKLRSGMTIYEF